MALGVAQLQDRLTIVEVVAGKKLIEPEEVLAQISELRVVEFLEIRRDRFRRDHRREAREEPRQFRTHLREFVDGFVRRGNARVQL